MTVSEQSERFPVFAIASSEQKLGYAARVPLRDNSIDFVVIRVTAIFIDFGIFFLRPISALAFSCVQLIRFSLGLSWLNFKSYTALITFNDSSESNENFSKTVCF